jgi:O-antigen ligase
VNLADDDGFQVSRDKALRSPHNIHMNVLARMGVPGLFVWTMMHLVWLYGVGDAYLRSRRRGDANWCGLFLWLFAYYMAFMINGSFDVFIEGPMGGVWFWSIYGTGVAALWTYRHRRDIFAESVIEIDDNNDSSGENSRSAQLLPAAGWRGPGLPVGA